MGTVLPEIARGQFVARLETALGGTLERELVDRLFVHYEELRRWNPRLSLIGPGTADQVVERHYAESLMALPELEMPRGSLVDLGSGGGFPGWVLAAALPEWEVTLVEPNNKKRAFLFAAARRAELALHVLGARVESALPEGFPKGVDRITARALKLTPSMLAAVAASLNATGRMLIWAGAGDIAAPNGWIAARGLPLPGQMRRIVVLERIRTAVAEGKE
jgi:16S rRNA (guanine527-N7)-methyltransferase